MRGQEGRDIEEVKRQYEQGKSKQEKKGHGGVTEEWSQVTAWSRVTVGQKNDP